MVDYYNNNSFYPANTSPQTYLNYRTVSHPVNGNIIYNYDNNKALKFINNNTTNVYPNYYINLNPINNNNHYNNSLSNLLNSNNIPLHLESNYGNNIYNNLNNKPIVTQNLPMQTRIPETYCEVKVIENGKIYTKYVPNNNINNMNNNTILAQNPIYHPIPQQIHPIIQQKAPQIVQNQPQKVIPIIQNKNSREIRSSSPINSHTVILNNNNKINDKLLQNKQMELNDIKTDIKNINLNNNTIIPNNRPTVDKNPNDIIKNKQLVPNNHGNNINNQNNNNTFISNNKTAVIKSPNKINNDKLIQNNKLEINNINQKQIIPKNDNVPANNNQNNINIKNNINNINKQIINQNNNNINKQMINQNNNNNNIIQNFKNNFNQNQDIQNNNNTIKVSKPHNNFATVKKIEDGKANFPAPTPIKKKIIDKNDYLNIIYNEIGMINLGNTCFINSCLQVLIHCPLFIHKFFDKYNSMKKEEAVISHYFYDVCTSMVNTINTQEKYIDITNFKSVFGTKHQIFEGYLQNDSQEFCRIFLEDLSTELNEIKNKALYKELTYSLQRTKTYKDKEYAKNFTEREKSIITEIFYSQIITTFTCKCHFNNYSFQKLLDFPLLLPKNIQQVDITSLLKGYCQVETIDFERKCENCNKIEKHQKEIKISSPPEILILSLQRIDPSTQKKNECIVTFPDVLDIKEFIDHECKHDSETIYNLFSVINHKGNMDYGHYFSYIKFYKKEDWYLFNDSSVKKLEKKPESFPYAYALFYIKDKYIKK